MFLKFSGFEVGTKIEQHSIGKSGPRRDASFCDTKTPQEATKTPQRTPKTPQDALKTPPRRPKTCPSCAQNAPRRAQDAPRPPQEARKTTQDAPRRRNKKRSESDPKRNPFQTSILERFGVDFGQF